MDAFDTLGISPSFSLDLAELASRQRELSRALHPDKYVGRPAGERRAALGRAIEVNEAVRALKNPLTRGEVLLRRLGLEVPEGKGPPASPILLMSMMEKREDLRDAGRREDLAAIEALTDKLREEAEVLEAELSEAFTRALQEGITEDVHSPEAEAIHQNLGALRYYRRFFDEAEAIVDELA